jgi:hypothetical protein
MSNSPQQDTSTHNIVHETTQRTWSIWLIGLFIVAVCVTVLIRLVATPDLDATIHRSDDLVKEGVARTTMDYLRSAGFDVVEIDNYKSFDVERSFVIDRVGDSVSTRSVARALGIADSLYVRTIDSTLYVRCTIVLGKDCTQLRAFR